MADNTPIKDASDVTVQIRSDELAGGVQVQVAKIALGLDGVEDTLLDSGQQTMANSLPVAIASNQTAIPVSDGGGVLTVDGAVTIGAAIPAGTNNIGDVDVLTLPALAAGNNNIGDVDIASIAAGDNNIGNVDIASAIPAGTNNIGGAKDNGAQWASVFGVTGARFTSANQSAADAAVTDAPTSGQKLVITDVLISVDAAMRVDLKEETTATILASLYLPANGTAQFTPRSTMKLATADKKLMVRTSGAGNIAVTAFYYSEA